MGMKQLTELPIWVRQPERVTDAQTADSKCFKFLVPAMRTIFSLLLQGQMCITTAKEAQRLTLSYGSMEL